ncbi:hypothetical protein [Leptospira idonii]|uniref:Uncharacterized protein n=1 Tax=Leptospira idonii TaxID=1193500 RepID=A0A4R9LXU3_9LEPT|nr:hypothetical protein [Leptospira idonii]TGN18137.1 hypothetical protein EHS15_12015 [Leptospira idonii]
MEAFNHSKFYSKKSFLKIFGGEVKIFNETGEQLLFYVKQKAFKLKEDITVYNDENKSQELLKIKARSVIDFSAAYDVLDVKSNQQLGTLQRKGFASIIKDEWVILDASGKSIGTIQEDSYLLALLRRFLTNLIPQSFHIFLGTEIVGTLKQTFNPFVPQFRVDFSQDTSGKLDRKLGIAAVILLQIIEGRQN